MKTRLLVACAATIFAACAAPAWSATTATGGTGTTTGVCQQTPSTLNPDTNGNLACGQSATASGGTYGGAVAIGPDQGGTATNATGNFSIAIGSDTTASGANSVALGPGGASSGSNSVALGAGSNDGGQSNVVSVGNTNTQRKIINVGAGALGFGSTDAVNGSQLYSATNQLALALGGGASATPYGLLPPSYTINGTTYGDVGSALNALAAQSGGLCQYNAAGGIVCGHNTTAATGAVAQGDGASAGYAGSLAIGAGATITAPTTADGLTTGAVAIGQGARANADPATALGYQANAAGANSVALGYQATANGNNSVALGAGSVANRANSVSVGSATLQRQITNVAPGTAPSDAVNLGQVQGLIGQATSGILSQANQHADEVAAMAAATSMTPQFGPKGYALTAAVAGVGSQSALGVGFAHAFAYHDHPAYWQASVGFNGGSGTAAVKVGASIGW